MHATLQEIKSKPEQLFLIAGPCIVESEEMCLEIAEHVKTITSKLGIPFVFKASYRKANRTRTDGFQGIGDLKALEILKKVSDTYDVPILTDVHESIEASMAAEFVDVLQIPAYLSRQTELIRAAALTGRHINIKKAQFLPPGFMKYAALKAVDAGNDNVWLTERGTMFGYGDLVVDFRGLPLLRSFGHPVIMDCTHTVQTYDATIGKTGGDRRLIDTMAKAAIAVGVDGLFIETHPTPETAKSDADNMLPLHRLEELLEKLLAIRRAAH